jgi:hypothetical protein
MTESRRDDTSVLAQAPQLSRIAAHRGIRVLTWDADILYACRRYHIVRLRIGASEWETVAQFRPALWRTLTSHTALSYRLMRDGFHALVILTDGTMVGAVPGAIVTRSPSDNEFTVTHYTLRGKRPLHITATPSGKIYWGEYFDNHERAEVYIYASEDRGSTWHVAYTFPARGIRHVHNIVYDRWADCLWILTGDERAECKILRASCDMRTVETVISGNQQTRAVAAIPTQDALYLSTDTPYEQNHVYRLDRSGQLASAGDLNSSSIYGCQVGDELFFSTMVEPSAINTSREVHIVGAKKGNDWRPLLRWNKDCFSMRYFQYGNAILPDGENATRFLAATTIAVEHDDLTTTLWEIA